jgi:hypothetical protein
MSKKAQNIRQPKYHLTSLMSLKESSEYFVNKLVDNKKGSVSNYKVILLILLVTALNHLYS